MTHRARTCAQCISYRSPRTPTHTTRSASHTDPAQCISYRPREQERTKHTRTHARAQTNGGRNLEFTDSCGAVLRFTKPLLRRSTVPVPTLKSAPYLCQRSGPPYLSSCGHGQSIRRHLLECLPRGHRHHSSSSACLRGHGNQNLEATHFLSSSILDTKVDLLACSASSE